MLRWRSVGHHARRLQSCHDVIKSNYRNDPHHWAARRGEVFRIKHTRKLRPGSEHLPHDGLCDPSHNERVSEARPEPHHGGRSHSRWHVLGRAVGGWKRTILRRWRPFPGESTRCRKHLCRQRPRCRDTHRRNGRRLHSLFLHPGCSTGRANRANRMRVRSYASSWRKWQSVLFWIQRLRPARFRERRCLLSTDAWSTRSHLRSQWVRHVRDHRGEW